MQFILGHFVLYGQQWTNERMNERSLFANEQSEQWNEM